MKMEGTKKRKREPKQSKVQIQTTELDSFAYSFIEKDRKIAAADEALSHSSLMNPFEIKCKPFHCHVCRWKFSTMEKLQVHNRIHFDPQHSSLMSPDVQHHPHPAPSPAPSHHQHLYKCTHCDKKFNQRVNLNNHERIHTGEKPYTCQTCSRKFVQWGQLQNHVRVHTGEKPFKCPYCSSRFTQRGNRNTHVATHHSNQNPNAVSSNTNNNNNNNNNPNNSSSHNNSNNTHSHLNQLNLHLQHPS